MPDIRSALLTILIVYLVVCAAMYFLQERLLYYPSRMAPAVAEAQAVAHGLDVLKTQAGEIRGYVANDTSDVRGTVIVFHGNAGYALHRAYYAEALGELGYRVLLAEYPGYGPRAGKLSESSLVADALDLFDDVTDQYAGEVWVMPKCCV